ncbi:MAG: hypothetical protein SNJ67_03300 [Chloracidobacterium sp.]|uniref:Uncharacterized protein n=1 Tax=Chloracidobacterium validum TaxID=2821543 RepID=A0ABX8B9H3_9BACT|nr:hypothetical protein [Chloracidobacterium validum]QUW02293.1 hypothetical protein J8C06_07960 [Chloracidobacterium validum]
MLTGFNTDITHNGVVYHVQTEDKGPVNPLILSLVYVGGQILAAKRTYYTKDLEEGATPSDLQKKLEKQHKAILALIARGRVEELITKRDTASVPAPAGPPPPPPPLSMPSAASVTESLSPVLAASFSEGVPAHPSTGGLPLPPPPPPALPGFIRVTSALDGVLPIAPESSRLPPPPPPPPPSASGPAVTTMLDSLLPSLGQSSSSDHLPPTTGGIPKASIDLNSVVNQYVASNLQSEKPVITLLGEPAFYAGETVVIQAHVTRGVGGKPIPNAPVIAKVFGTHDRPHRSSASTGEDGTAVLTLTLPNFHAGTAAVVISVTTDAGEAEVKHLIRRRKLG